MTAAGSDDGGWDEGGWDDDEESTMTFVDGNELAGPLRELFAFDMTMARGRCAGCGSASMIAQAHVYDHTPGLVARCPTCEAVLIRLVRAPGRAYLDLRGVSVLEVPLG
jgi:hypothetical protein